VIDRGLAPFVEPVLKTGESEGVTAVAFGLAAQPILMPEGGTMVPQLQFGCGMHKPLKLVECQHQLCLAGPRRDLLKCQPPVVCREVPQRRKAPRRLTGRATVMAEAS
jgi:hypothetical protein